MGFVEGKKYQTYHFTNFQRIIFFSLLYINEFSYLLSKERTLKSLRAITIHLPH